MTPKEIKSSVNATHQLGTIRYGRCGKLLIGGGFDGAIRRWSLATETPKEIAPVMGHSGWIQTLAFHPDQRRLFSGDSWGKLACWNYADVDAKPVWSLNAHDGWLRKLAIAPDGATIATCGMDRAIRLWSATDGRKLSEFDQKDDTFCVAFHPKTQSIVAGDLHGSVRQWNLKTGKVERTFDMKLLYLYERIQDVGGVRCLAFDESGKYLAIGGGIPKSGGFVQGNWLLKVIDWESEKEVSSIQGAGENDGFALDALWHPSGSVMAVTSGQPGQGKLFFHKPHDSKPFFTVAKPNCHSLDLHPNGKRLVVAATNADSAGNGRVKGRGGEYPSNYSPLWFWDLT